MLPTNKELVIYQGATFKTGFLLKDVDGSPFDLTGWSAHLQARVRLGDATPVLDLSSAKGSIILGTASIGLYVSDEDTARLNFGAAMYDLTLTSPAGESFRVLEGRVQLRLAVTRE